ncbi:MAG: hypothetical protein ACKV22_03570 [Bryobacteraceae bacterium]
MRKIVLALMLTLPGLAPAATTDLAPEEVIRKFAAKEALFLRAREQYTYRQTVRIIELSPSGTPLGKMEMVSDIVFSPDGKRTERVVRAPVPTLQRILLTPEDEQDLRNVQPFVLTSKDIDRYQINYLSKQNVDEIPCYLFSVKPKKMEPGQRYFEGQIWVDDRDLQIVKTYGKGVGILKKGSDNQFPRFETYREQIDGKFWFPTYTVANDTLQFQTGPQRIRMQVKYENYKRFGAETTIEFGEVVDEGKKTEEKKPEPPKQ